MTARCTSSPGKLRLIFALLLGASTLGNLAGGEWLNSLIVGAVFAAVAWPWLRAALARLDGERPA